MVFNEGQFSLVERESAAEKTPEIIVSTCNPCHPLRFVLQLKTRVR